MAAVRRLVVWFRTDLRLHDHPVLTEAKRRLATGAAQEILPVYCFDPREWRPTVWSDHKTGAARSQFLLQSVENLRESLEAIGSKLRVYHARPEEVLPKLSPTAVLAHKHVAHEESKVDKAVDAALRGAGAKLELIWGHTLYHKDDLPFKSARECPDVFTPFRNKVERLDVRKAFPPPGKGDLGAAEPDAATSFLPTVQDLSGLPPPKPCEQSVLQFKGGEKAGLERLKYYLWDSDKIATYFDTRNGMLGGDYSTKFSPWLAHGCLSPRKIYWELQEYERKRTKNKSTYWVCFELLWRDFFYFFTLKHGRKIFMIDGTAGYEDKEWNTDPEVLKRWKDGTTGYPLVDANMREMKATGFMSNRGRQNVASYLALDLGFDWRAGASWFEEVLLDYDVCANWGNWVAAAGLTGGRVNKFNITKQARDYDNQGKYVKAWIPELANVPTAHIFEPWLMPRHTQESVGCVIGKDYPPPLRAGGGGGFGGGGGKGYSGGRSEPRKGKGKGFDWKKAKMRRQ